MKIKELIAELLKLPQEKELVITSMDDYFWCDDFELHSYIEDCDEEDEALEIILPYYFFKYRHENDNGEVEDFDYTIDED